MYKKNDVNMNYVKSTISISRVDDGKVKREDKVRKTGL